MGQFISLHDVGIALTSSVFDYASVYDSPMVRKRGQVCLTSWIRNSWPTYLILNLVKRIQPHRLGSARFLIETVLSPISNSLLRYVIVVVELTTWRWLFSHQFPIVYSDSKMDTMGFDGSIFLCMCSGLVFQYAWCFSCGPFWIGDSIHCIYILYFVDIRGCEYLCRSG